MTISKARSSKDVIEGAAVIRPSDSGAGNHEYDPADRTVHVPEPSGLLSFQNQNGRFLAHDWAAQRSMDPASPDDMASAAAGTDATLYLPAQPSQRHVLAGVAFSYASTPVSGVLQVQSPSGTTVFQADVTAAGAGFFDFPGGLRGGPGQDLRVVLTNGASAKKVSLLGRRKE